VGIIQFYRYHMSQVLLISRSDIAKYRSISVNANAEKKLNPYILSAQEVDLKELIGNAFHYALVQDYIASPSLSIYGDLFNGSTWVYAGNTYSHKGLKAVLCLFAYSRYVIDSNTESTAFGTVEKKNEFSVASDMKRLASMHDTARSEALAYWNEVRCFLNDNSSDYTLWSVSKSYTRHRISGVDNIHGHRKHNSKNRFS
jgi:hypothetical protein